MEDMDPNRVPRKRDMSQINRSKSFNLIPARICDTKNKPQTIFRDNSSQPCQRHQDRQVYLNEHSLVSQQRAQTYPNLSDEYNRYDIGGRSEMMTLIKGHYNPTVFHKLHQPKFSTLYEELTTNYSKYKRLDDQLRERKISKRQPTPGPSSLAQKSSTTEGGTSSRQVRFPFSDQQLEAFEHEYSKYGIPNETRISRMSQKLIVPEEEIRSWFKERREKEKAERIWIMVNLYSLDSFLMDL